MLIQLNLLHNFNQFQPDLDFKDCSHITYGAPSVHE